MKTRISRVIAMVIGMIIALSFSSSSQAPQSFNYQAIVRDAGGEPMADQPVSVQVSLHQGAETGPVVYAETYLTTTSPLGLVNLGIGTGTVVTIRQALELTSVITRSLILLRISW